MSAVVCVALLCILMLCAGARACQSVADLVQLNGSEKYALLVWDVCELEGESECSKSCDLLLNVGVCEDKQNLCPFFDACDEFVCSYHDLDVLEEAVEACRKRTKRESPDPCDDAAGGGGRACGPTLEGVGGECVLRAPSHHFSPHLLPSVLQRMPVSRVQFRFLGNNSFASSATDPAYMRVHAALAQQPFRPLLSPTVSRFFASCFPSLLQAGGRLALLNLPGPVLVEIGLAAPSDTTDRHAFVCSTAFATLPHWLRLGLMLGGISASLLGLILTSFAIFLVGDHRTISGITVLFLSADLGLAYIAVPAGVLGRSAPSDTCVAAGVIHVLTLLSAIFWTNVLAFDMWRALGVIQHLHLYRTSDYGCRLLTYAAYAWGVPALLLVAGAILDCNAFVADRWKPAFVVGCWFTVPSTLGTLLLYHAPIGAAMLANTVLFLLTARLIGSASRQHSGDSRIHDRNRSQLRLYIKLLLAMGLPWAMEALAGPIDSPYYEVLSDFVNSLQGVFIFAIFGCKNKARQRVKRICCGVAEITTTPTASLALRSTFAVQSIRLDDRGPPPAAL